MLAAYGVDVLDPHVSARRVWTLLERMPPTAREQGEIWSAEAHLLALLIDHVANLTYVTMKAAGAQSVSRPRPITRPGNARELRAEPPERSTAPRGAPSWAAAARDLAKIPGVVVKEPGDG